jgi:3'(2'), 5'-bisphosphate nucleotidase
MGITEVIDAAKKAGKILLSHHGADKHQITLKKDNTPVCEADLSSHDYLIKKLQEIAPYPVLSEESPIPYAERKGWESFWMIDPLDGTREFLAGGKQFTVNIALIKNREPILGVIYAPALDSLYAAEKGKGAVLIRDKKKISLPLKQNESLIAVKSRTENPSIIQNTFKKTTSLKVLEVSSALKFGLIAEGKASFYPREMISYEWDVAAGHLLLSEIGFSLVSTKTQNDLQYNKRSLKNPPFLAFSPELHPGALRKRGRPA